MLSFITSRTAASYTRQAIKSLPANAASPSGTAPTLTSRTMQPAHLSSSFKQSRATYYYAANHQTAITFTSLLSLWDGKSDTANILPAICTAMQSLLQSIRPKFSADQNRQADFDRLLTTHLHHLDATGLVKLSAALRQADFHCAVTDPASRFAQADHTAGAVASSPQQQQRMLMDTPMLYARLDALIAERRHDATRAAMQASIDSAQIQAMRNILADCAWDWQDQIKPELFSANLLAAARKFSSASGLGDWPQRIELNSPSGTPITAHALVHGTETTLFVQASLTTCPVNQTLMTRLLRDVLEQVVMKKCCGMHAELALLLPDQVAIVRSQIDAVMNQSPSHAMPAELRNCADRLIAQKANFGTVQIMPPVGTKLGHAWIAPALSIVPNRNYCLSTQEEFVFLQTGNSHAPQPVPMKKWPAKFLQAAENEKLYPAEETLHLTVPVEQKKLQDAALNTKAYWQDHQLPYLFMGTAPDQASSGCRATVWHAILQGMDTDAMTLFTHFNRGLPDPDSPIELWLRMHGFMQWMEKLADQS